MPVVQQAVDLFTPTDKPVRMLDLGSGSGILSAVTANRSAQGNSVIAIVDEPSAATDDAHIGERISVRW